MVLFWDLVVLHLKFRILQVASEIMCKLVTHIVVSGLKTVEENMIG